MDTDRKGLTMKPRILHIGRGFKYNTVFGHDEIISRYGPYSYIVHHYDHAGTYHNATYMTDVNIILAIKEASGEHYNKLVWS